MHVLPLTRSGDFDIVIKKGQFKIAAHTKHYLPMDKKLFFMVFSLARVSGV